MKEFLKAFSSAGASDAYKYLGTFSEKGKTLFRVWAPNAAAVSVVGDFNEWDVSADPMNKKDGGIWEIKISGLKNYAVYKYAITGPDGTTVLKSDPYARHYETAPANASKLYFSDCPPVPGMSVPPHQALAFTVGSAGALEARYVPVV